jgi:hypothetical protein
VYSQSCHKGCEAGYSGSIMDFYFPTELGEQLAFGAAAFTAVVGFIIMFAPGYAMRLFGLAPRGERRDGYAEQRSMGGFYLGCGLSAIMLAQNWNYMALGAAFAMAAFARVHLAAVRPGRHVDQLCTSGCAGHSGGAAARLRFRFLFGLKHMRIRAARRGSRRLSAFLRQKSMLKQD